ncbi:MAG TPA: EamA family transporter [Candidatus Saccharimonadales bacterium]|nr:EamA family transporter [Candidatus Saccharimonadales bacterium]
MATKSNTLPVTAASSAAAKKSRRFTIALAFLAIYVIWGSTYLAIRFAVETIPPLYTAGFRHFTAGSILLVWCLAKRIYPTWAQIRSSIVIGFFFFLIGHGSLHWAEQRVPSGLASLLIATEPIFVFMLASAAAGKWRVNTQLVLGAALGLGGVALLMGKTTLTSTPGMFLASIAILVGALSWSAGIIYSRTSSLSGQPLLLSSLSSLSGSVLLLIAATVAGEYRGFSLASVTPRSWAALVYLILFGSVTAFTAYNWLLEHYSPTLVATHTYVNPIVAVLLGWLFAGEAITLNVCLSAALVIFAVFLVDRGTAKLPPLK